MKRLKERLFTAGFLVVHVHYVGSGADGVIRCSVFADHTPEHIDGLLAALRSELG